MSIIDKLISEFDKNSRETVRVSLQSWKGGTYCDIRVWSKSTTDEPGPTHKGITLRAEMLSELRTAIDKALAELEVEEAPEGEEDESAPDPDEKKADDEVPF